MIFLGLLILMFAAMLKLGVYLDRIFRDIHNSIPISNYYPTKPMLQLEKLSTYMMNIGFYCGISLAIPTIAYIIFG